MITASCKFGVYLVVPTCDGADGGDVQDSVAAVMPGDDDVDVMMAEPLVKMHM